MGLGGHSGAMGHSLWMALIFFRKVTRSTTMINARGTGIRALRAPESRGGSGMDFQVVGEDWHPPGGLAWLGAEWKHAGACSGGEVAHVVSPEVVLFPRLLLCMTAGQHGSERDFT